MTNAQEIVLCFQGGLKFGNKLYWTILQIRRKLMRDGLKEGEERDGDLGNYCSHP